MIFVITGSEAFPFDRLIQEIDLMKKNQIISTEVFIQLGSCNYIPSNCTWEKWLPFNKMRDNIASADLVIAHAGAGTTLLCLEMSKSPILVTRRSKHGEHVDDHQVEFALKMDKLGYASVAFDVEELKNIYQQYNSNSNKNIEYIEKIKLISVLKEWLKL